MAQIYIQMNDGNPSRKFTNGLIALITGVLTLIRPDMLTVIIAAYLISNGLVYFFYRSAIVVGAASVVAGIFIFAFPNLIPYAFAFFLLILSFGAIMSGGLSILGIMAFVFALIILGTPEFVNYVIAAFLVFYGTLSLMNWSKMKKSSSNTLQ